MLTHLNFVNTIHDQPDEVHRLENSHQRLFQDVGYWVLSLGKVFIVKKRHNPRVARNALGKVGLKNLG